MESEGSTEGIADELETLEPASKANPAGGREKGEGKGTAAGLVKPNSGISGGVKASGKGCSRDLAVTSAEYIEGEGIEGEGIEGEGIKGVDALAAGGARAGAALLIGWKDQSDPGLGPK